MLARTARVPAMWGELPDAASQVVALLDGPYTEAGQRSQADRALEEIRTDRHGEPVPDIFRDPYLDGLPDPRMTLLVVHVAPGAPGPEATGGAAARASEPVASAADPRGGALCEAVVQTARDAGVRVSEYAAGPGHPLERLADLVALTDFTATYFALGLGLDPAVSAHLADLRDHTQ